MKLWLTVGLLLIVAMLAWSYTETFYVAMGGDGSLPETNAVGTAWDLEDLATVANWNNGVDADDGRIGANDCVILLSGGGTFQRATEPVVAIMAGGSSGKPITIMGDGSTVIDGQDARKCVTMEPTGSYAEWDYVTLDDLEIIQADDFGLVVGVTDSGVTGFTMTNCYVHDTGSTGLFIVGDNVTLQYNTFGPTDTEHGVYFGGDGSVAHTGEVIEYNYFVDCYSGGLQFNMGGAGANRHVAPIVRFNWFEGNGWSGITDQDTSGMLVYGNIFEGNYHSITSAGDGTGVNPINIVVVNNTFYGDASSRTLANQGWGGDGDSSGATYANNIFHNTSSQDPHYLIGLWDSGNTITSSNYNRFYHSAQSTDLFCTNASTTFQDNLTEWQSAISDEAQSTQGDPGMVAPGSSDFTLDTGSACIDNGTDLGDTYDEGLSEDVVKADFGRGGSITLVDRDAGGATGDGWDIGAYEMDGAAPPGSTNPVGGMIIIGLVQSFFVPIVWGTWSVWAFGAIMWILHKYGS